MTRVRISRILPLRPPHKRLLRILGAKGTRIAPSQVVLSPNRMTDRQRVSQITPLKRVLKMPLHSLVLRMLVHKLIIKASLKPMMIRVKVSRIAPLKLVHKTQIRVMRIR